MACYQEVCFLFFPFFVMILITRLDRVCVQHFCVSHLFFFFSNLKCVSVLSSGSVHYSWDSQISFFNKTFIKNESHGIIHTFKNYVVTVFSIFSFQQISGIQMDPNCIRSYHLLYCLLEELTLLYSQLVLRYKFLGPNFISPLTKKYPHKPINYFDPT